MQANNDTLKNKVMIEFTKTIEMFGLSTLEARLFAYLYLTNKPMTLDEMSEALGKSKTSMSTGIRSLADLNLVSQVWKKGVRKDLYLANSQPFKNFLNSYVSKWADATSRQKEALEEIKRWTSEKKEVIVSGDDIDHIQLTKRLDEIIDFHHQLETLFRDLKKKRDD